MKTKTLLFIILVSLLAGCSAVDDTARISGTVIGRYGDDILSNADILLTNPYWNQTDDLARIAANYLDDILRSKPAAQSIDEYASAVARSLDDISLGGIRSVSGGAAPLAISQISRQLSPVQDDILRLFQQDLGLNRETSLAFLDSTCNVVEYIEIFGEAPSPQYALFSMSIFMIQSGLPDDVRMGLDLAKLSNDAVSLGEQLAADPSLNAANIQEGAELIFDFMCLVP